VGEDPAEQPAGADRDRGADIAAAVGRSKHVIGADRDLTLCNHRQAFFIGLVDLDVEVQPMPGERRR
jgi:hypothetical protein